MRSEEARFQSIASSPALTWDTGTTNEVVVVVGGTMLLTSVSGGLPGWGGGGHVDTRRNVC